MHSLAKSQLRIDAPPSSDSVSDDNAGDTLVDDDDDGHDDEGKEHRGA